MNKMGLVAGLCCAGGTLVGTVVGWQVSAIVNRPEEHRSKYVPLDHDKTKIAVDRLYARTPAADKDRTYVFDTKQYTHGEGVMVELRYAKPGNDDARSWTYFPNGSGPREVTAPE